MQNRIPIDKLGRLSGLKAGNIVVPAVSTDYVISKPFGFTDGREIRVDLRFAAAATVAAGITIKLQGSPYKNSSGVRVWETLKTVTVLAGATGAKITLIDTNVADALLAGVFPLPEEGRVVISTGAGDAVTISGLWVLQGI